MYRNYNPNPKGNNVGDCVIRALTLALNINWQDAYVKLCLHGLELYDMPSANHVWGSLLQKYGYKKKILPNECPACYSVRTFAEEHPEGEYVLATGSHAVYYKEGTYYDSWDSGDEAIIYYFQKGEKND